MTDILLERRSIRKYKNTPVPEELLDKVLEAGTFAPTGMNRQTPIMVAVTNKEIRDLLETENARVMGDETRKPFYGAPAVITVFCNPEVYTSFEDACLVMGNLLNAAHAVGLGGCWIHRAREVFELPEWKGWLKSIGINDDVEGVGNLILGYPNGDIPEPKETKESRVYYVK